jgi:hypothetical protein
MTTTFKLSFSIEKISESSQPHVYGIIPKIDNILLTELISSYEGEQRFEPAGGYGGLVPMHFNYGPLDSYFKGQFEQQDYFAQLNGIYLLGCSCGEVGCWPLIGQVRLNAKHFVWENFRQPFRLQRDYSKFGPFIFDIQQYREAIEDMAKQYTALQRFS